VVADSQAAASDRVETDPIDVTDTQMLGVTWPTSSDVTAQALDPQVRTLENGRWSDWSPMDSDNAPDAGTPDAQHERGGTDSVWIGGADAVQLSFAATAAGGPADMRLALVKGADSTGTDSTGAVISPASMPGGGTPVWDAVASGSGSGTVTAVSAVAAISTAATTVAVPTVISRAAWGARAPACAADVASTLVGAVVHHTADPNTYSTVDEAMARIRADQAYHIDGRGWCDTGYNFIVDKWGNIYEGRANSLTEAIIGVHAGGFNTGTVGVAMLGTYDSTPPAAMVASVAQIIGWRLGAYGIDPTGTMQYKTGVGENSRFKNQTVTLPRVFGHRDVAYTDCPGNGGYAALGTIRQAAKTTASGVAITIDRAIVTALYADLLGRGPDPMGLAGWSSQLLAGVSVGTVATQIAFSTEYVQRVIANAYAAFLHRAPDPTGLATWTVAILSGRLSIDDLSVQLLQSDEYYERAGGTPEAYVNALYEDVLERDPGPGDVTNWSAAIRSSGRAAAAGGIWRSLESARLRVGETYLAILSRGADPSG